MGAGRWRLVRQLLTESLLLSLAGGALGSLIAFWSFMRITQLVASHLPHNFPPMALNVAPNLQVLGYALVLSLVTGIAFGLVPALRSSRPDVNTAIKGDGTSFGAGKKSGRFLLNTLVGSQVAVCMVLLLAAGLLLRGLYQAQTIDPGFEIKGVATMFMHLGRQGYDQSRATQFMRQFRERIQDLPGVTAVAQAECAPLSHDHSGSTFTVPGRTGTIPMEYNHVSFDYFRPTQLCFMHMTVAEVVEGLVCQARSQLNGTPITVAQGGEWKGQGVMVDPSHLSRAFTFALRHVTKQVGADSDVAIRIAQSARRETADLEIALELHQPNEASPLFRASEAGMEWAVAQKIVALHGGDLLADAQGTNEKTLRILLPLCP